MQCEYGQNEFHEPLKRYDQEDIAEMFHLCALIAMKFALHNLKDSDHQMRNRTIKALIALEVLNLSVLLCSEEFIHKLNKDWRDEDRPTDVLSMSQNIPELELQILMVGDIVILVEPVTRHVEERRCSSLDEINILLDTREDHCLTK